MFAMPHQAYGYGAALPQPPPSRQHAGPAAGGTSSAFSSSALPDEDWTKISDLAERRRIQNRIAQRNYRKKLKRRLEDLERRAGSSDDGEPESRPQMLTSTTITTSSSSSSSSTIKSHSGHATKRQSIPKTTPTQRSSPPAAAAKHMSSSSSSSSSSASSPPPSLPQNRPGHDHGQFTPPMDHTEDVVVFAAPMFDTSDRSLTPPAFSYPPYPSAGTAAEEQLLLDPYAAASATAQPYPAAGDPYPTYVSLHPFGGEHVKGCEEPMGQYLGYGFVAAGLDMGLGGHYDGSPNANTSPSLSHSYDTSTTCSDAGGYEYEYPSTPLSMPDSPDLLPH